MRLKKIVCLLFCLCLISGLPIFSQAQSVHVELNGEEIYFPDVQPCLIQDRTMVPMRAIFEALGAGVYWEETGQTIFSMRGNTTVILQIDNPQMFVNNNTVILDVPPVLLDDRTMVPLRAVSESFGLIVDWDDATQTVYISEN